ncbi:MAG: hypothetical protein J7L82_00255 [Staphylothermus sp.]|nr:hypothetical protein [Staphylothermus sp.]
MLVIENSGGNERFFYNVYGLLSAEKLIEVLEGLDLYVMVRYVFDMPLLDLYTDEKGSKSLVSFLEDIDVVMHGGYKIIMNGVKGNIEELVLCGRTCKVLEFFPENILAAHFVTRFAEIEYQNRERRLVTVEDKICLNLSQEKNKKSILINIPVKNTSIYALVPE